CGHFPLTLVSGPGAAARNSIGLVLVAGMAMGTAFTLFFVPAVYMAIARTHRPEENVPVAVGEPVSVWHSTTSAPRPKPGGVGQKRRRKPCSSCVGARRTPRIWPTQGWHVACSMCTPQ